MPKGRVLTPAERETIVEMHRAGASGREIAKKLERSKTVVLNFLRDPAQYAQIKRSGRKRALSSEDERRLYVALFRRPPPPSVARSGGGGSAQGEVQEEEEEEEEDARLSAALGMDLGAAAALSTSKSAEQIKREFNLPLSVRRIQQLLSEWRTHARRQMDVSTQARSGEESADSDADRQQETKNEDGAVATSDDISTADAMLALPDEKSDKTPHPELPGANLEVLGIEEPTNFPDLQLALAVDKLPSETEVQEAGEPGPASTSIKEGAKDPSTGEESTQDEVTADDLTPPPLSLEASDSDLA